MHFQGNVYGLFSFRDHTYEVIEHCPRTLICAEPVAEEMAAKLLNSATSCKSLFHLVLLEKHVQFVLATDSMCVSDCMAAVFFPVAGKCNIGHQVAKKGETDMIYAD